MSPRAATTTAEPDAPAEWICPECERPCESEAKLNQHLNGHRLARSAREARDRAPAGGKRRAARKGAPLQDRLQASFGGIGGGLEIIGLAVNSKPIQADGRLVVQTAPQGAQALAELAAENETVAKACELIAGGGAWGAVIIWALTLLTGVAANHGWMAPIGAAPAGNGSAPAFDLGAVMNDPNFHAFAAQMFGQQAAPREPLRPEGTDPDLTEAREVG